MQRVGTLAPSSQPSGLGVWFDRHTHLFTCRPTSSSAASVMGFRVSCVIIPFSLCSAVCCSSRINATVLHAAVMIRYLPHYTLLSPSPSTKVHAPSTVEALGPLRVVSLSHAASLGHPRLPMRWPAADTQTCRQEGLTDMFASRGSWSAGTTCGAFTCPLRLC